MPFEYTGHILERELLGEPNLKKYSHYIESPADESERKFRNKIKNSYLSYNKALELVKLCQSYDTSDPEPDFANDLHAKLAEELCPDDFKKLNFYTAIGSHLDYRHGVDAFIEFENAKGRILRLTLDVTGNPNKDVSKADILFSVPAEGIDRKENRGEYMRKVEEVAEMCVKAINIKLAH